MADLKSQLQQSVDLSAGKPGVYRIEEVEYHEDSIAPEPGLSSSLARLIVDRSPLHAWTAAQRLNPSAKPRYSEAFDIGKAAHKLILTHGADVAVIHADDWRGKEARAERDAARAAGAIPMLAAQFDAAIALAERVQRRLKAFGISIDPARAELAAYGRVEDVWCRALIDYAPADPSLPLVDIKTCEDASPDACVRAVAAYGYDVQAAFYRDVWEAATGQRRGFRFVFVEKTEPHEVSVVELHEGDDDADWMLAASDKAHTARMMWRDCLAAGHWPGYPAQVAVIGAPAYHAAKWEGRARPAQAVLEAAHKWQAPAR